MDELCHFFSSNHFVEKNFPISLPLSQDQNDLKNLVKKSDAL